MDSNINVPGARRTADRTAIFIVRVPIQRNSRNQPDDLQWGGFNLHL